MKSVGEVMAIGRTFQEALQKGCQSLEIKRNGMGADGKELLNLEKIMNSMTHPSWNRIFHIKDAMSLGIRINTIHKTTGIDKWFLNQIEELVTLENEIQRYRLETISVELMMAAKKKGYADRQIAHLLGYLESQVFKK